MAKGKQRKKYKLNIGSRQPRVDLALELGARRRNRSGPPLNVSGRAINVQLEKKLGRKS
jgi:hypothetical protein